MKLLVIALATAGAFSLGLPEPAVKKTTAGVCHDKESRYFQRLVNYTAYPDLYSCIKSGGRLPLNVTNPPNKPSTPFVKKPKE